MWREATGDDGYGSGDKSLAVGVEFPNVRPATTSTARLDYGCLEDGKSVPDLVLLRPEKIPREVFSLQLAAADRFEVGPGYAYARIARPTRSGPVVWVVSNVPGKISPGTIAPDKRQFTGDLVQGYWFTLGSSGCPVFLVSGQQLAGLLSLVELGGQTKEAFIVPGTTIRVFVARRLAEAAGVAGIEPQELRQLADTFARGERAIPIADIPSRLKQVEFLKSIEQFNSLPPTRLADLAERMALLKGITGLNTLIPTELAQLALQIKPRQYDVNAVICHEGHIGEELFLISNGEAKVERAGHQSLRLGRGAFFGTLATGYQCDATVTAAQPLNSYVLHKRDFAHMQTARSAHLLSYLFQSWTGF